MTATKPYRQNDIVVIDISKIVTLAPFKARILRVIDEPFIEGYLIDYQNLEFECNYDEFGTCTHEHITEVVYSRNITEVIGNGRFSESN